mgnify:CR=1 FL=1
MYLYVLTGYNGELLDPVLSFSYDQIYKKMEEQYHESLKGIKQTTSEKECTYLTANNATAVIHGEWYQWAITKLDLPLPNSPANAEQLIIKAIPQNPYLLSYFQHKNLSIGDTWIAADYILWIDQKHEEFRKLHHLPEHIDLNDSEIQEFIRYLNSDRRI